jgi:hypothetical protein
MSAKENQAQLFSDRIALPILLVVTKADSELDLRLETGG